MITLFQWNETVYEGGSKADGLFFPYAFLNHQMGGVVVLVIEYNWWGRHFSKHSFSTYPSKITYIVGKQPHIPLNAESKKIIFDAIFKDSGNFWK